MSLADTYAASPGHCDTVVAAYPYSRFRYAYCYAVVALPDSDALASSHCYSDALAYQHTYADTYGDTDSRATLVV